MDSFNKEEFLQEILSENDPVKLLQIRTKYAITPYCKKTYCYSITNVIYDILSEEERSDVLEHIKNVCKNVSKKWHILTDIDDTIKVSNLGGTNVKYKNHTVYPGVVSFYDKVIHRNEFVTLLSARPESLAVSSRKSISKYIMKPVDMLTGQISDFSTGAICDGATRLCYSIVPSYFQVAYPTKIGHISGADQITWYTTYKYMGQTKFDSIKKYITIFPEFKFIFIGDSGQGDMICSYLIHQEQKKDQNYPVKACFIHNILKIRELNDKYNSDNVGPIDDLLMIGKPLRDSLKTRNIYLFNNYIDLAGYTHCLGLLGSRQLRNVITETITDFNDNKKSLVYREEPLFISYLENDLERAKQKWSSGNKCN